MNTAPLTEKLEAATQWKDAQALKSAVREWSDRIKVKVKQIQLGPMKRKWASISTTGRLTLNTELLDLPKELGEFAIVHELVHLLVPNHGKLFKCFMSAYLPDWEEREKRLQGFVG
ncbi:M48 family metallopeptidase [Nostoc flagelliforme FACHB-838]|uniref:M48 family metallopeptidase n=1 Tax=Nostoc flagelliforme FACHB-838 TaxID=2692904 RepID=A0ABR8DS03_9NOSO|nr:M48 family metallopeptidase [Nostoc flagelliforme]MBD2532013.1 M48 family metallopeptidase [Nostoc flagelliforme FACHB-838]